MSSFRLLHALFGVAVLAAYFTAEESGVLHAWIGYVAAALILIRVLLGLLRRAGFSFRRIAPRLSLAPGSMGGVRHPIVAQALTLALALVVATSAATGAMMDRGGTFVGKSVRLEAEEREGGRGGEGREDEDDDDEFSASLLGLAPAARADDGGREGGEEEGPLAELHEASGKIMLPLAVLHALYMLLFRFDLARFMLFAPRRRSAA